MILTIGGHISDCANPLMHIMTVSARGEAQNGIRMFITVVSASPNEIRRFAENLSPRIPLIICPAP